MNMMKETTMEAMLSALAAGAMCLVFAASVEAQAPDARRQVQRVVRRRRHLDSSRPNNTLVLTLGSRPAC